MVDVDALIAKGRAQFKDVEPVVQEVLIGDELVGVRLVPAESGAEWRELTLKHPPREGIVLDQNLGYNVDAVTAAYPKVSLVQGDEATDVSGRWSEIVAVLAGPALKALALAIWGLNEYEYQKQQAAAGKASEGGRRRKRSSPAS